MESRRCCEYWICVLAALAACGSPVASGGECAPAEQSCSSPADCCSNRCDEGICAAELGCADNGAECSIDGDCCSNLCAAGKCVAVESCQGLGATCDGAADCCSARCASGLCLDVADSCGDVGEPCTSAASCCSGRCEPVTGTTDIVCLGVCFADGIACERAQDCCSLGCFDGVCGGRLCIVEGEPCRDNAECCSNLCGADGECEVDRTPGCRPTGEDCTSGGPTECCGVCNEELDRCDFADDTCRATGAACADPGQCCSGRCELEVCVGVECADVGGACDLDSDCCQGNCDPATGLCAPPPGECRAIGEACGVAADCCTNFCLGGFCDIIIN